MYASRFLAIVLCASAALGLAIPAPADEGDIIIREENTDDDIIIRREAVNYIEWQPRRKVYIPAPLEDA